MRWFTAKFTYVLVFHVNKKRRYLIEKGREKYELKLFQSWEIKIQLSHCINTWKNPTFKKSLIQEPQINYT